MITFVYFYLQNYIRSLIAKDPELKRTKQYSVDEFNMLLKKHDLIEQISQAYLEFLDKQEVCITGGYDSVCYAQTVMEAMLRESTFKPLLNPSQLNQVDEECSENRETVYSLGEQLVSVDGEINSSLRTWPTEAIALNSEVDYDQRHTTGIAVPTCSMAWGKTFTTEMEDVKDCSRPGTDFDLSLTQLDLSSQNNLTTSHHEINKIQNEPGYSDKLEFAIKLGYTEENLLVSLRKLGAGAGQNELLSELIKLDSGKYNSEGATVTTEDDSLFSAERSDSYTSAERVDEGFCEDGSNLRPIVIDGSNVAMR